MIPFSASQGAPSQFPLDALVPQDSHPQFERGRGSKGRTIYIANPAMALLQYNLLYWLKLLHVPMPHAHGSIRGRSPVTNAQAHHGNRFFFLLDLKQAYESLDVVRMASVLRAQSASLYRWPLDATVDWLNRWCFLPEGGLITGGSAAPQLFNIYCARALDLPFYIEMGRRTRFFLADWDLTYTRYLDDLTFSSPDPFPARLRRLIYRKVSDSGFTISQHKTRVNLDITKGPVRLTGTMLHQDGRIAPSKRDRRRANGLLASALSGNVSPSVGHGHAGAIYARLPGTRDERFSDPAAIAIRRAQERLLRERPMYRGE